jgi:hypothetical protein
LEPLSDASVRNGHNAEIIAPVPPKFADSSPEEFIKVMFSKYFKKVSKNKYLHFFRAVKMLLPTLI